MIQIAEIECDTCQKLIAHVQVVPGSVFVRGEAFCPDCFDDEEGEG